MTIGTTRASILTAMTMAVLATPSPAPAQLAKVHVKCFEAVSKAGLAFVKGKLKVVQKCLNTNLKNGVVGDLRVVCMVTDSEVAPQIIKLEDKLAATIAKGCDISAADLQFMGFPGPCNDANPGDGFTRSDLSDCILTSHENVVAEMIDLQYDPSVALLGRHDALDCQSEVGKQSGALTACILKNVQKCRNAINKGKQLGVSPDVCAVDHLKTRAAIAKCEEKLTAGIPSRCSQIDVVSLKICTPDQVDPASAATCLVDAHTRRIDGILTDEPSDLIDFEYAIDLTSPARTLRLKSREFIPEPGLSAAALAALQALGVPQVHAILQLHSPLLDGERDQLEALGVTLGAYLPNNAFIVGIPLVNASTVAAKSYVRSLTNLTAQDKMDPFLLANGVSPESQVGGGIIRVLVKTHEEISATTLNTVVANHGGTPIRGLDDFHTAIIELPETQLLAFLGEDAVWWVDDFGTMTPTNAETRIATNVDATQGHALYPSGTNGSGVVIGLWDVGVVASHAAFGTRVTTGDVRCPDGDSDADHATHDAGTSIGSGAGNTPQKGMATAATLVSYTSRGYAPGRTCQDPPFWEYSDAINARQIDLAVNPWTRQWFRPDYFGAGTYDTWAQQIDEVITGKYGRGIPLVFSAGNWTTSVKCNAQGGFRCVTPEASAKNTIAVGATNSNDDSIYELSSHGPADDGRIKPEVVAPGCQNGGDEGITSTLPGNTYGVKCGTSSAASAVGGISAILLQGWRNAVPLPIYPSSYRALLIHSAADLGNPGPDYVYGFGAVDTAAIANLLAKEKSERVLDPSHSSYIYQDAIAHGQEKSSKSFTLPPGVTSFRATLTWDDPKAAVNASTALVNDLDLVVKHNQTTHLPWLLDPSNPSADATHGRDAINNVEQVDIFSPTEGTYTAWVEGKHVFSGPQKYSLVVSMEPFAPPCHAPDASLRHWYTMDETSGTQVADRTGGEHGTHSDPLNTTHVTGRDGNASGFNHPGGPIRTSGTGLYDVGSESFMVDLWFKPDASENGNAWLLADRSSPDAARYIVILSNNRVQLQMTNTVGMQIAPVTTATTYVPGSWNYIGIAVDRASNTVDMYLNDDPVTHGTIPANLGSLSNPNHFLQIGSQFRGAIDEVEIYSGYKPSELVEVFQRGKCKTYPSCHDPDPSLKHWYTMDETSGTQIIDRVSAENGSYTDTASILHAPGKDLNAIRFKNAVSGITTNQTNVYDVGTQSFMIGLWFKPDPLDSGNGWLLADRSSPDAARYIVILRNGRVELQMTNSVGTQILPVTTAEPYDIGSWNYIGIAVDRQSNIVDMYLNDHPVTHGTVPSGFGSLSNQNDFIQIGSQFRGAIDEVQVYGRYAPAELLAVREKNTCK